MNTVRSAAPQLKNLEPYDPKYLPARLYLNANENPYGFAPAAQERFVAALQGGLKAGLAHRYPDPLAKELRARYAVQLGVEEACVLLGNGGDELLFNLCLAWGGAGRRLLIAPPTFSVYRTNALLTGTEVVEIPREGAVNAHGQLGYAVNEAAVLERVRAGSIDLVMLTSPNNPTGCCLRPAFVEQLLESTNALVLIDHAYIEFAAPEYNVTSLLGKHQNLAILRTFSKASGLAGLRIGSVIANEAVIGELLKVRQPYSVDSLAALAALATLEVEAASEVQASIERIKAERERVTAVLLGQADAQAGVQAGALTGAQVGVQAGSLLVPQAAKKTGAGLLPQPAASPGRTSTSLAALGKSPAPVCLVCPSQANFLLLKVPRAHEVWQRLYDEYGILVRDFSRAPGLENCLRVSIGTPQENDEFLAALRTILSTTPGITQNATPNATPGTIPRTTLSENREHQ